VIRNLSEGKDREENCENIVFEDLNGNTLTKSANKINLGKNEDTTIKAVYEENGRIYKAEIKVQKQGTQNSVNSQNNQTIGINSDSSQNKDIMEAYRTYIRNKKYETYSNNWPLKPETYCIYDINQDGIEELLIMSENDNMGWRSTLVCSYDKTSNQVIYIKDIYSYGELRYSKENREIVYSDFKPFAGAGGYEFYQLKNNQFVLTKSTGWSEEGKYFLEIAGSETKSITKEEEESYFKNLAYFKFSQLSSF
jgi:hypothetical protein